MCGVNVRPNSNHLDCKIAAANQQKLLKQG